MIEDLTEKQKIKWLRRYEKLVLGEIERLMAGPEPAKHSPRGRTFMRLVKMQSDFEDEAYSFAAAVDDPIFKRRRKKR